MYSRCGSRSGLFSMRVLGAGLLLYGFGFVPRAFSFGVRFIEITPILEWYWDDWCWFRCGCRLKMFMLCV